MHYRLLFNVATLANGIFTRPTFQKSAQTANRYSLQGSIAGGLFDIQIDKPQSIFDSIIRLWNGNRLH
jgi:hypothetical protein